LSNQVYINARFLTQPITGVQRFAIEISKQLKKLAPSIRFVAPSNIIQHELADNLGVEIFGRFSGHLWEQTELPFYLRKKGRPLLLCPANTAPLHYYNKIITIHDVAFERFPQTFSWKFRLFYKFMIPHLLRSCLYVITVSEFSRTEISRIYGHDRDNIMVVYNAVNEDFTPKESEHREPYILAVSSLNYRKNFHTLIKAFNRLDRTDVKFYIVGGHDSNFADMTLDLDIEKNKNIVFKGRVNEKELVSLYSNALCFVFPSLYEGFGIPPLEAQACGCPVLVSKAASLPEVFGDSALYCDPFSVEDIAEKISALLDDSTMQNKLRKRGFENVKRFSWETSAKQILKIMRQHNESRSAP